MMLRVAVGCADLLVLPPWLRQRRPFRGDECPEKLLYIEATLGGVASAQRTAARAPVLQFSTSRPAVVWEESLEFQLGVEGAATGLLQLRLMEKDRLRPEGAEAAGSYVARPPFKAQSGLLTCPDLTVAGSEPEQRNVLYFVLGEHELRFFVSKQAAEQRELHDGAPDGTFELALAGSVKISSKFTNCFELEMIGKSGTQLQLFIAETHELAMAWVERIDALLPTRRGLARLHYSDGTHKRTLAWQYDMLCVLKDHAVESAVALHDMQRVRLVTTHDFEIVANDGNALRFSCESSGDACTWVSTITREDPRFDVCVGHGVCELASVAEGCGGPAHDTWLRLAAKDTGAAADGGSSDTSRAPGGPPAMYSCVRVGLLHLKPSELSELDAKVVGDGGDSGQQQCGTAADWLQLQDNRDQETLRDAYGFSISGTQMKRKWRHMRDRIRCLEHYREATWLNFRAESQAHDDLALGVAVTGATQSARNHVDRKRAFGALIRLGVPRYLRPTVWLAHSGAARRKDTAQKVRFRKLVAEFERSSRVSGGPIDGPRATAAVIRQQIEKDLTRTFEGERTRVNSVVGKSWLKNILGAYSISNSSIGYCQSMNFLAACLLMYLDEEDAFWMLSVICEELAEGYYTPGLPGLQVDIRILADLLRSLHPNLWSLLQQCEVPLDLICSQWLMGLFSMNLPLETLFLLWDALFLHGHDILLAAALAALSLAMEQEDFARAQAFEDVVLLLKSTDFFSSIATDPVFFMDAVWEQMDAMGSVDVAGMRARHRTEVANEVVRSTALQEVHTLLGQMADADTDGAVRLEMSRAIRDLQQEVRDVKIQKIELERRLGNMVAVSPGVKRRQSRQPLAEGPGVNQLNREESASLTATQQRYDIEQAGIEQLQVDSARLQASIKDLHNQLAARKKLLATLLKVPDSDFTERSKKDTVASVASGITLCGEMITGLCSDKAIAEVSIKARTDMAKASNEAGGLYALLASSRGDIENAMGALRAGKKSMQEGVCNHFASLRQALDARERNLLSQVDGVFEDGSEYLGQAASSVEDLIADLSDFMAASGEDLGGAQTEQLRSIVRSSSEAHAAINQGMQNWVEQQPRCWLDEEETQWLGDRIMSYGHVGAQQPTPICTSVTALAGGQSEAGSTKGWPPAMPGWRVSHFSLDSSNVFATDTHILLQDDDAVSLVLETMKRKPDDRTVQQNGVACLRHITTSVEMTAQAQSSRSIERCLELGAIAVVAEAMKAHRSAVALQLEACSFLLNLSHGQSSKLWSQFVPCGGPQLLVDAISAHAHSVDVVTAASGCLREMLPSKAAGPFEGWDAFMQTVVVNSDGEQGEDFAVVTRATQDLLSASSSTALLVGNLRTYSDCKAAYENLFAVLGFLVQVYNHDVDAWSIEFDASPFKEAIGVALRAMEMRPTELWVHESALFYISCACSAGPSVGTSNDPSMDPTRRQLLATNKYFVREILRQRGEGHSSGGAFTVLASMRRHLDSSAVQGWSCSIIRPLVVLASSQTSLVDIEEPADDQLANTLLFQLKEMGITALVLGSMRCHPNSAIVQESAMGALHTLCLADTDILGEAVKDGGIAAAAAAMRGHSTAERVQSSGCCVLWAMSGSEGMVDSKSLLQFGAQENLMQLVLSTMRNYATSSSVSANAMGLLNRLVGTDGITTSEQIEDGVLLVLGAILCHKDDARVQANACSALCALMAASEEAMRHIVGAGGIALVLQSMQSHPTSESCAAQVCLALERFALADDKNIRTILGNEKPNVQQIDVSEEETEQDEEQVETDGQAALTQILAAMNTHRLCIPLLAAACRSLLALSPGFARQSLESSGDIASLMLPAVLGALSRFQNHAEIHQYGCLLLAELGRELPWRQRLLSEPNCVTILVVSLKTHQEVRNLEAVMKALRRVIPLISRGTDESAKTELVELIFRAMRLRGESRVLQAAACSNIWQLIEERGGEIGEGEENEEDKEDSVQEQADTSATHDSSIVRQRAHLMDLAADNSDTVLAAIRAHNESPPVLENGFRILGLLAEEMEHVRAELGADGVVSVVLGAILEYQSKHRGIPMGTLLSACECLGALGKRNLANQRALLEEGAVRLLVNVVKRNIATNLSLAVVAARSLHAMAPLPQAALGGAPASGGSEEQALVEQFVHLLMQEEALPLLLVLLRASAAATIATTLPLDGAAADGTSSTDAGSGWRNRRLAHLYTGGAKDLMLVPVATAAAPRPASPVAAEAESASTSAVVQRLQQDAALLILWQQLCELLLLLPDKALSRTLQRENIDLRMLRDTVTTANVALSAAATAPSSLPGTDGSEVGEKMNVAKSAALQSLGELVPVLATIAIGGTSRGRGSGRSSPVDDPHAILAAGPSQASPHGSAAAADGRARSTARPGEVAQDRSRQRATSDAVEEMGGKLLRFLRG